MIPYYVSYIQVLDDLDVLFKMVFVLWEQWANPTKTFYREQLQVLSETISDPVI